MNLTLKAVDALYGHLDDLRLFDASLTVLEVVDGYELTQVGETVVHPIASSLLDDAMRLRVLEARGRSDKMWVKFTQAVVQE